MSSQLKCLNKQIQFSKLKSKQFFKNNKNHVPPLQRKYSNIYLNRLSILMTVFDR